MSHLLLCSGGLARRRSSTGELWAEPTGSGLGRMWPSHPSCVCACTYGTVLCWTRQRRKSLNYSHLLLLPHLLSVLPHPHSDPLLCGDDLRRSVVTFGISEPANFSRKFFHRGFPHSLGPISNTHRRRCDFTPVRSPEILGGVRSARGGNHGALQALRPGVTSDCRHGRTDSQPHCSYGEAPVQI